MLDSQCKRHAIWLVPARSSVGTLSGIGMAAPALRRRWPPSTTVRAQTHGSGSSRTNPGPRQRDAPFPPAATPRIAGERFHPLPSVARRISINGEAFPERARANAERECRGGGCAPTERASCPRRSAAACCGAAPAQSCGGRPAREAPSLHGRLPRPRARARGTTPTLGAAMFSSGPNPVVIGASRQTRAGGAGGGGGGWAIPRLSARVRAHACERRAHATSSTRTSARTPSIGRDGSTMRIAAATRAWAHIACRVLAGEPEGLSVQDLPPPSPTR